MLRVYGCVFCSIFLLCAYMCMRWPSTLSLKSTSGVPFDSVGILWTTLVLRTTWGARQAEGLRSRRITPAEPVRDSFSPNFPVCSFLYHFFSFSSRNYINTVSLRESWIEAHLPKNVKQVTAKQRNGIGRHGHHVRDDPWTENISRALKKSPWDNTTWKIMTINKIVLLYRVKARQVIRK